MSDHQKDIKKFNAALHDQSTTFTEDKVCKLIQNLNCIEIEKGIAESGSVNFLKSWMRIGFKVTRTMVEIATKNGNLAFLKECFADNEVASNLMNVVESNVGENAHIQVWLDGLESQP